MLKVKSQPSARNAYADDQSPFNTPEVHNINNVNVQLSRAMFIAVPAENPVHYRPMVITFDDYQKQRLENITEDGININHAALAEAARDILSPSRQSQGEIAISRGWDEQRFAVFLEFEVEMMASGTKEYYMLTGYTDHLGLAERLGRNSQEWDPNMELHVTSYMKTRTVMSRNGYSSNVQQVQSVNQILRPVQLKTDQGYYSGEGGVALRPFDNLTAIQRSTSELIHKSNAHYAGSTLRSGEDAYGHASNRYNELSSKYLEKIFKSYSQASNSNEGVGGRGWLLGTASSYSREDNLESMLLFNELSRHTSYSYAGFIRMGELLRWQPHLDQVTEVAMFERGAQTTYVHDSNSWGGAGGYTVAAHALTHTVPAALTTAKAAMASFVATNRTLDGRIAVTLTDFRPIFPTDDDRRLQQAFIDALELTVLPEIFGADDDFDVEMTCSQFAVSVISIRIGDGAWEPYRLGNYADGLTSSLTATGQDALDDLSYQTNQMLETVFDKAPDPGFATRQHAY